MKGAVSAAVLVVIALVVVGAIGYSYLQKPAETPVITRTTQTTLTTDRECQSKLVSYCTTWSADEYGRDVVSRGGRLGPWDSFAAGCSSLGVNAAVDVCERTITASAATGRITQVGGLGFLEPCNPERDVCGVGLICKLGRDTYRCLR